MRQKFFASYTTTNLGGTLASCGASGITNSAPAAATSADSLEGTANAI